MLFGVLKFNAMSMRRTSRLKFFFPRYLCVDRNKIISRVLQWTSIVRWKYFFKMVFFSGDGSKDSSKPPNAFIFGRNFLELIFRSLMFLTRNKPFNLWFRRICVHPKKNECHRRCEFFDVVNNRHVHWCRLER